MVTARGCWIAEFGFGGLVDAESVRYVEVVGFARETKVS